MSLRFEAVWALGVTGDYQTVSVLSSILSDPEANRHLRVVSALALGELGTDDCVAALAGALNDPETSIRFKAIQALGHTRKPSALALVAQELADPDAFVQACAIHALGEIGKQSSVPMISRILHTTQSDFIKLACLTALSNIPCDTSKSLLLQYQVSTNPIVCLNARELLGQLCAGQRSRQ
jgi:HEAT repeat protein